MKKLFITLLLFIVSGFSMTFFVANMAEKEIKTLLSENQNEDFSIELLSYERGFFSATAISEVHVLADQTSSLPLKITTTIYHYPYQAVLNNHIEITDQALAKKVETYFGTTQWITSTEKINLFAQLTGQLRIVAGEYKSDLETLNSEPVMIDYQVDLKNKSADVTLNWAGLTALTYGTAVKVNALQLSSHIASLSKQSDYNYHLTIKTVEVGQDSGHSLLEGVVLKGRSQQGEQQKTIDTDNELIIDSYQINMGETQTFTDNRLKLALTGLYQPAFELLNTGAGSSEEVEHALIELVSHGAQLTLSQLNSQTPWGEVDGTLDLVLDKGASLTDIVLNPYILFDYMSGDASLVLPIRLLDEPAIAEPLQMGLMTGFLEQNAQTLNLKTSFQQGELIVNGRIIPL
ncbi:DUF945 family protein [Psychromonas sp. Urea-02u-13]|uniref:DUF945 family protein n=1 Tax=Psychromonas sp. Urea-02u-13 TaxID=2058326 RepID=UPI000C33F9B2|nr:DUF945 family protein [Psychromonas sp. Urea-02u-13]PKG40683.1 hypothetical protein CXF74_01540 [Psychromonas sp. Urea-02u-13]